jgi:hypothetical protein
MRLLPPGHPTGTDYSGKNDKGYREKAQGAQGQQGRKNSKTKSRQQAQAEKWHQSVRFSCLWTCWRQLVAGAQTKKQGTPGVLIAFGQVYYDTPGEGPSSF